MHGVQANLMKALEKITCDRDIVGHDEYPRGFGPLKEVGCRRRAETRKRKKKDERERKEEEEGGSEELAKRKERRGKKDEGKRKQRGREDDGRKMRERGSKQEGADGLRIITFQGWEGSGRRNDTVPVWV